MRARVLALVGRLRDAGVDVSVAETMDAARAVAVAGVERAVLREALAATLVKDEADRPTFDPIFDAVFPLVGAEPERGRRRRAAPGAGDGTPRAGGRGAGGVTGRPPAVVPVAPTSAVGPATAPRRAAPAAVPRADATADDRRPDAGARLARRARVRALMTRPFRDMTALEVTEARAVVEELGRRLRARLARRERAGRRGRLDFRRTIRAATSHGGVPVRLRFRARRPGRPDLVALCDVSGSVATASELCLGLLAPASAYFRRVHFFAFVDRLCAVSIERGHVAPGEPLDLHARSDFGRVLDDLWARHAGFLGRDTVVLVLGDARNNRLPPRPALLRGVRDRVRRLIWLVPEPEVRWNTGDSVLRLYAPACDVVLECVDLAQLVRAVRRTL